MKHPPPEAFASRIVTDVRVPLSIRFSPAEIKAMTVAAKTAKVSVGELVRRAVGKYLAEDK